IHEEFVLSPSGYIAWVGNTRYGFGVHYTTNGSSQYYHRQYVDALFAEDLNELAAANDDSRTDNVGYIGYEANRWVHYELTAFGDPAMPIWTATPQAPELEHMGVFVLGTDDYSVTVRVAGAPVEGARVCMWDDEGTAYDFGITDANGDVTLHPHPSYPGTMHLVVSDANLTVTDVTMPIIPTGPYIVIESHTIDDLAGGNGDGDCDAGETIELAMELHNVWTGPITGVWATLLSGSEHVEITDDIIQYGDFAGGEIKPGLAGDVFVFHISGACPDQQMLHFDVEIHDDGAGLWTGSVSHLVDATALSVISLSLDDAAGGNGNGCLDPGESAEVTVTLANDGHQDATTVLGTLCSANPWLTITQPTASAVQIPAGSQTALEPPFGISLDAGAPTPGLINCTLGIEGDWELDVSLPIEIGIGGLRDDMESGEGGWTHTVVTAGFTDQWHLSEQRNHTPEGAWSWKFGSTGSGDYANLSDGALITEPIAIAEITVLAFWHWIDAEKSAAYPGLCYDGGLVEMSIDEGDWEQITPEGGYPYLIREGGTPGPFPVDTPVFSGQQDWTLETFTLDTSGGTAQFRFRFGSDGADTREGWYIDDVEVLSWLQTSDVGAPETALLRASFIANRPNPFAPDTQIRFDLPDLMKVRLSVYDTQGRLIRTLADGNLPAGTHTVAWDGRNSRGCMVGAGVYLYRLETGTDQLARKMTLLR
ncbi:MAG: T9SS type A sorting domain-containing protein, partial [Candidatus Eisenbacteria sp.]|nr:T9SS type A sorting domain-containing protein [Candidatus Eisenbacteria bacterium]